MRNSSKRNDEGISGKIELMVKVINRTDSYLNSANTKSTILLSLASALIVALSINFDKITGLVHLSEDKYVISFLVSLALLLLITSVIFSLIGITPYIQKSEEKNSFSFVDIAVNFKDLSEYRRDFSKVGDKNLLNQLIALNHNLSRALIGKYERQIVAIQLLKAVIFILGFLICIIVLSNF